MAFSGSIDGSEDFDEGSSPRARRPQRPQVRKGSTFSRKPANPLAQEAMDTLRNNFLQDLDDSTTIEISDWEADFLSSNLSRKHFSDGQRKSIDKMRKKYENRL
ncbi:MAG: hypothetical protein M0Q93_00140 [Terrimicrobiaceae bacterium]|jgi:hypothetical protein|nr:hypothetical protein [Terrimicrobiaceae bacterium]